MIRSGHGRGERRDRDGRRETSTQEMFSKPGSCFLGGLVAVKPRGEKQKIRIYGTRILCFAACVVLKSNWRRKTKKIVQKLRGERLIQIRRSRRSKTSGTPSNMAAHREER